MTKIIYFDIAALCINIIIVFSFCYRGMTKGASNKLFIFNTIWGIFTTIFDIWAVTLDLNGSRVSYPLLLGYLPNSLYLFFHVNTIFIYTLYNISLIDFWNVMFKRNGFWIVHLGCCLTLITLLFANIDTKWIFYIDNEGIYQRGVLFGLVYLIAAVIFIYSFMFVIQHKEWYNLAQFKSIILMYPIILVAVVIQMLLPFLIIELFCISLVTLLISQTVQRPEVFMDGVTGFNNFNSFVSDIGRLEKSKYSRYILLIKIKNIASLRNLLSFEHFRSLLRRVAGVIKNESDTVKGRYRIYYLGDGKFAVLSNNADEISITAIANLINKDLSESINFNYINVNVDSSLCIVNFPGDFNKIQDLIIFNDSFANNVRLMGNVYKAKDIIADRNIFLNTNIDKLIEKAYMSDI